MYGQRGQYDDAIGQFEIVLEQQENSAAGYNNLGNIYTLRAADLRYHFEGQLEVACYNPRNGNVFIK